MYPLISIIIPFYNTEKYLRRCVSSMTSQTYQNLEIILMDDGSTDQSSLIADDLSAEDSRIRVFHTANSGVAAARNNGLKNARGTFVMFVDSDDWMDPTIIQDMWERMEQTKADLVTCDIAHSVEKPTPPQPNEHPAFHLYSNKDYLRLFFKIDFDIMLERFAQLAHSRRFTHLPCTTNKEGFMVGIISPLKELLIYISIKIGHITLLFRVQS